MEHVVASTGKESLQPADMMDFHQLFLTLPGAYIVMAANDPVFTIVAENQAHADIALADPATSVGKPVFDVFPDNSEKYRTTGESDLLNSFRKVIRTGKPDTMPLLNYDVKDAQGKFVEKWWRVTHYPGRNTHGKVAYVIQATEDITKERVTAKKFEMARVQLDSALDVGLVSTWYWEIDSDIVIGDRILARSFGVSAESAANGLPLGIFIKAIHPDDRDRVTAAIQDCVKTGVEYEQEYRTIDVSGKQRWVIARGRRQEDADSGMRYMLGIIIDLTDRREAEEKFRHSNNMFNALFQSSVLSVAVADMDGRIIQANKSFLKSLGYTTRDLRRGLTSRQITAPQSVEVTTQIYNALRNDGQTESMEKTYIRKDGSPAPMLVSAVRLPDNENQFIAVMFDISENKKLEAINQAKDEFIGMASHQLRTPATVVKQYVSMLQTGFAGDLNKLQKEFVDKAYDSNERQLHIVNELLKTAQLDANNYVLTKRRKTVAKILDRASNEMLELLRSKRQKLVIKGTALHSKVYVDATEINLVMVNLIENASKYSDEGTNITVTCTKLSKRVEIAVSDKGVGIAQDDIGRIFGKFTRIDSKISDTVRGSGLGLYLVDKIIKAHAGDITVKSTAGKGSTFTIRLPYAH